MSSPARPKVFGVGLSKTGTKSLQEALVSLGYTNHTWDPALHERWYAGDIAAVMAVAESVDCVEDWPFLACFAEFMDRWGDSARYVLTVRKDEDTWLDSVIVHAARTGPAFDIHRQMAFGYDHPWEHPAEYVAYYHRHNAAVREAIAARGLGACFAELCWEAGDGWPQLCALIGAAQPNHPFPHANQRPGVGAPAGV